MPGLEFSLEQLRGLIGLRVRHQGREFLVVEVLEDRPSLVLAADGSRKVIQTSLHGDATRRVPETVTIPVLSRDHTEYSREFLLLDLLETD